MTVEYNNKLATATMAALILTIFRWSGSVYKLLWKEFLLFFAAFYTFQVVYIVLPLDKKSYFLFAVEYCQRFGGTIPVTLFLGFYVSKVVERFFNQFDNLPWLIRISVFISSGIEGSDEAGRKFKRMIIRYCNLCYVMVMTAISNGAKKRFPTFNHLTTAGLLVGDEQEQLEKVKTVYLKYFIPIIWACNLVLKARREGKIKYDYTCCGLIRELTNFWYDLMNVALFDFVQLPLVYTQSVTLCVYTFFFSCLLSRQDIDGRTLKVEISFPFFTFLQFFFYVGWLKVAEEMLNPYGEDEDDFDVNMLIDFNIKASYLIVDEMHAEIPVLAKDKHFDSKLVDIPYTLAAKFKKHNAPGSPLDIPVPTDFHMYVPETSRTSLIRPSTKKRSGGLAKFKKIAYFKEVSNESGDPQA